MMPAIMRRARGSVTVRSSNTHTINRRVPFHGRVAEEQVVGIDEVDQARNYRTGPEPAV